MSSDIQISLEALATMIKYDLSVKGKETAGLLIGEEIDGAVHIDEVRIGSQVANSVHVEISVEELIKATVDISERTDGKSVVGWVHTHPGLRAYLSPTDINTQNNYQALYGKAVAIVIDAIKYSHTLDLKDLDLGVFRVVNGKEVRQNYGIKESTEFGLRAFIENELPIEKIKPAPKQSAILAVAPIIGKSQLKLMKLNIEPLLPKMTVSDRAAISAWIELTEAMQSGDFKEVPIDVVHLQESLTDSIDKLDDNMYELEFKAENKRAEQGLLAIIGVSIVEIIVLFNFLL